MPAVEPAQIGHAAFVRVSDGLHAKSPVAVVCRWVEGIASGAHP
jgi:hypothetical protein